MNPKEKAAYLVVKYMSKVVSKRVAIECALVAVDEIMKCTRHENQEFENDRFSENYWQEVKQEIEKA